VTVDAILGVGCGRASPTVGRTLRSAADEVTCSVVPDRVVRMGRRSCSAVRAGRSRGSPFVLAHYVLGGFVLDRFVLAHYVLVRFVAGRSPVDPFIVLVVAHSHS
jgi:hypothetical protein